MKKKTNSQHLERFGFGYAFIATGVFATTTGINDLVNHRSIINRGFEIPPPLYFMGTFGMIALGIGVFYYNRKKSK